MTRLARRRAIFQTVDAQTDDDGRVAVDVVQWSPLLWLFEYVDAVLLLLLLLFGRRRLSWQC